MLTLTFEKYCTYIIQYIWLVGCDQSGWEEMMCLVDWIRIEEEWELKIKVFKKYVKCCLILFVRKIVRDVKVKLIYSFNSLFNWCNKSFKNYLVSIPVGLRPVWGMRPNSTSGESHPRHALLHARATILYELLFDCIYAGDACITSYKINQFETIYYLRYVRNNHTRLVGLVRAQSSKTVYIQPIGHLLTSYSSGIKIQVV